MRWALGPFDHRRIGLLIAVGWLGLATSARAAPLPAPEPPAPFAQGTVNLGLAMGLSTGGGTAFSLGLMCLPQRIGESPPRLHLAFARHPFDILDFC